MFIDDPTASLISSRPHHTWIFGVVSVYNGCISAPVPGEPRQESGIGCRLLAGAQAARGTQFHQHCCSSTRLYWSTSAITNTARQTQFHPPSTTFSSAIHKNAHSASFPIRPPILCGSKQMIFVSTPPNFDTRQLYNNKLASLGYASPKLRNYDSLTHLLTGVKCRATSVANKNLQ